MPLEKFPATFNLMELHKGWFPHAFNKECNFSYVGPFPAKEDYDPDSMDSKKRENFLTWHNQQVSSNAIFNFQEELLKYCESDVALLKEGCLKFIKEFKEIAGFNPFTQSITITADMKQDKWHETGPNQLVSIIESISIFERHICQN